MLFEGNMFQKIYFSQENNPLKSEKKLALIAG
jgi:hypothetical protein